MRKTKVRHQYNIFCVYRRSKEFGNPPSYEEISAAEPIKEETEKDKLSQQQQGLFKVTVFTDTITIIIAVI